MDPSHSCLFFADCKLAFWRQQKQSAKARLKEARPPRRSEMRLAREKPVGNALPRHELGKLFDPFLCPLGDNHSYRYTIFLHICMVYMYVVYIHISMYVLLNTIRHALRNIH